MIDNEIVEEIALEFLELKNVFNKIGFEIIGSRKSNNEIIYFIKKKELI